ncbi:MAG: ribonuclease III [Bacteroidales bacterium]|nr:ribonuclease III [Bacteroidales bacterium]MBR1799457.1 ribonuclease III [Bacteroidales bacterium]
MSFLSLNKESRQFYLFFKNILGFRPRKTELYRIAFTHRSHSLSRQGHRINNERLEYLGDAVLGMIVAEYLYKKYPLQEEGFLTIMRSKIVSRKSLNQLARKIGLLDLVEHQQDVPGGYKSMGGDAFEALVGAIYLEKGFNFTRRVLVDKVLCTYIDIDEIELQENNYKSKLIDWCQKRRKKIDFVIERSFVREHSGRREYECRVKIDGVPQLSAIDYSIKGAEQLAAEKTYKSLQGESDVEEAVAIIPSA